MRIRPSRLWRGGSFQVWAYAGGWRARDNSFFTEVRGEGHALELFYCCCCFCITENNKNQDKIEGSITCGLGLEKKCLQDAPTCNSHGGSDWGMHLCRNVRFQEAHRCCRADRGLRKQAEKKSFEVNDHGLGEQEEVAVSMHVKISWSYLETEERL